MLVVPMHGKIIIEVSRISARLDSEVVGTVIHIDTIAIPRTDQGEVGNESIGKDVAPSHRSAAISIAQSYHLLH